MVERPERRGAGRPGEPSRRSPWARPDPRRPRIGDPATGGLTTGGLRLGPKPGIVPGAVSEAVGTVGFTGPLTSSDLDVAAAAHGDHRAFAAVYDRYGPRLYDFCLGMLRDPDAAADAVQDTFCTAAARLHQLREPDKLRPWLYAIARHESLRRIRGRTREQAVDEVPDRPDSGLDPATLAARGELAALVADAAGGLSDRDRTVLDLHYRHGLDGPALADALGVSPTAANTLVGRLRNTVERSLGALLVARRARARPGRCPELDALLRGWDGRLTVLLRKRVARHLDQCSACDAERHALVNPTALLASAPMVVPAPFWLRDRVLTHAAHVAPAPGPSGPTWWPTGKAGALAPGPSLAIVPTPVVVGIAAPVAAALIALPVIVGSAGTAHSAGATLAPPAATATATPTGPGPSPTPTAVPAPQQPRPEPGAPAGRVPGGAAPSRAPSAATTSPAPTTTVPPWQQLNVDPTPRPTRTPPRGHDGSPAPSTTTAPPQPRSTPDAPR